MLKDLLEETTLTLDKVGQRRVVSEKVLPSDPMHQELAREGWALVPDIFGREKEGEIQSEFMEEWLKVNRIPEGWRPTQQQDLMATNLRAKEIRKNIRSILCENQRSSTYSKNYIIAVFINFCLPDSPFSMGLK
jgi:hypothetical protein